MFDLTAKSYKTHFYSPNQIDDHEDSGPCSPPLWRTSPPGSPHGRQGAYRSLSPGSKAQAIARGQKELMEMVSKMPESCYELSLKDLVEVNVNQDERKVFDEMPHRREKEIRKTMSDKRLQMNRNGSINHGGFLLKMVFPVSLGSKKRKKKKKDDVSTISKGSKVSPRPSVSDGSTRIDDKEWWKKGFSESGESESGVSSINSGSMKSSGSSSSGSTRSRSSLRDRSGGCWTFLRHISIGKKSS